MMDFYTCPGSGDPQRGCVRAGCAGREGFQPNTWGDRPMISYPMPSPDYQQPANETCPDTGQGFLEQQFPIAMAYVPWQQWKNPYSPEQGLAQGTIFPDLDLQFNYGRCGR